MPEPLPAGLGNLLHRGVLAAYVSYIRHHLWTSQYSNRFQDGRLALLRIYWYMRNPRANDYGWQRHRKDQRGTTLEDPTQNEITARRGVSDPLCREEASIISLCFLCFFLPVANLN